MQAHKINTENNFIAGWYISKSVCSNIIQVFKDNYKYHDVKPSPRNYSGIDLFKLTNHIELLNEYLENIQKCLENYIKLYPHSNEYMPFNLTEANLQCFKPNKYYDVYHHENNGDKESITRHLVFITYLNDIKTGGYTEFLYQNTKIKPEQGLTIIWPCHWTHTHRGTSTPEEKFIATGWFNFTR